MATEYCIIYKYTGQYNVHNDMIVNKNKFTISGDTTKRIGRISKIEYVHSHSSTNARTWNLYGRLTFEDETYIESDTVSQHISGTVVTYTNTFIDDLPSPTKFSTWEQVQTRIANPTSSVDLYWRANSDYPMYIYVYFIEAGFIRYGVDGIWTECEVYFGTDGNWKQVSPYYGANNSWNGT